jgi:hypothetical protein
MNSRIIGCLLLSWFALPAIGAKKPSAPDVLVVADVHAEDADAILPTKEKPVYYVFLGGMEQNLGAPIGGIPPVNESQLKSALVDALASRGFVQTKVGGPMPSIVILYTWGDANLDTAEIAETDSETGDTTTSSFTWNGREMARLVGLYKAQRHMMSSMEAQDLSDAIRSDRGYLFIAALDAKALLKKQKKLVWRTRISIDTTRTNLVDNIPVMLASAAPYFARDEARPVIVDDNLRREATVKLGDIKFLGEVPAAGDPKK